MAPAVAEQIYYAAMVKIPMAAPHRHASVLTPARASHSKVSMAAVSFVPVQLCAAEAGAMTSPGTTPIYAPAGCANPVSALAPEQSPPLPGWMEIPLGHGRTVKVDASVDADALRRIIGSCPQTWCSSGSRPGTRSAWAPISTVASVFYRSVA